MKFLAALLVLYGGSFAFGTSVVPERRGCEYVDVDCEMGVSVDGSVSVSFTSSSTTNLKTEASRPPKGSSNSNRINYGACDAFGRLPCQSPLTSDPRRSRALDKAMPRTLQQAGPCRLTPQSPSVLVPLIAAYGGLAVYIGRSLVSYIKHCCPDLSGKDLLVLGVDAVSIQLVLVVMLWYCRELLRQWNR